MKTKESTQVHVEQHMSIQVSHNKESIQGAITSGIEQVKYSKEKIIKELK